MKMWTKIIQKTPLSTRERVTLQRDKLLIRISEGVVSCTRTVALGNTHPLLVSAYEEQLAYKRGIMKIESGGASPISIQF
jgi:hypothetical protein